MSDKTYEGHCFCGAVQLRVSGVPKVMGYCHCTSCREWSAAPLNAFTLWTTDSVSVTEGQNRLGVFHKTETAHRQFCTACGGHLMTAHPTFDLIDVYAAVIPGFAFEPTMHIYYQEKALTVRDGLPKFKDMPKELGGSGEMLLD